VAEPPSAPLRANHARCGRATGQLCELVRLGLGEGITTTPFFCLLRQHAGKVRIYLRERSEGRSIMPVYAPAPLPRFALMALEEPRRRTGILLAFQDLEFAKQPRRRVKPRVVPGSLGLTEWTPCSTTSLASKSSRKTPKSIRRCCLSYTTGTACSTTADASGRRRSAQQQQQQQQQQYVGQASELFLHWVLSSAKASSRLLITVDRKLGRAGCSLAAAASNHGQFLKHSNAPLYEGCSLSETAQLLAAVQEAIHVLGQCRGAFGDAWLVAQGVSVGLCVDEGFLANYEHLLLRLRTDLVDAMARKVFRLLLRGGYDKQQRKLLSWFAEFADKPRPLSSSFPWTIKPSLAVLWGVCWMYYAHSDDDTAAAKGTKIRVPLAKVLQNIHLDQWDAPASSDCKYARVLAPVCVAELGRRRARPPADWHSAATSRPSANCQQHAGGRRPGAELAPGAKHGMLGVRSQPLVL